MKRRHHTAIQRRVSNRAHLMSPVEQAQRYDRLENVVSQQAKGETLTPRERAVLEAFKLGRFGKVRT